MNISKAFDDNEVFKRLDRRRDNFKIMCEHAASKPDSYIIETGTAWDKDNWEYQGQSSRVWDWLLNQQHNLSAISIDIREEASQYAKEHCSRVHFLVGDSPKVLNDLGAGVVEKCSVLYLDSMDWTANLNMQSALHHLVELTSVWAKLPKGCLIAVDDRHGNGMGKHWLVESYMDLLGIAPIFKNHQIGWVKP